MSDWDADSGGEIFDDALAAELGDMPAVMDILPDGRDALVIGDFARDRDLFHPQGDNPYGFKGTCGLVSCEEVLRQFGVETNEAAVVGRAIETGLCQVSDDPASSGGTTAHDRAALLTDLGVPAHSEQATSLEEVAQAFEHRHGVIAAVNVGYLWNDVRHFDWGHSNHAVTLTAVARSPRDGHVLGFFINDSGRGVHGDAGRFVDAKMMQRALIDAGGQLTVTDGVRPDTASTVGGEML